MESWTAYKVGDKKKKKNSACKKNNKLLHKGEGINLLRKINI